MIPNHHRVVITGLGVISSIGIGWEDFWDSLLKGISGISDVSCFDTTEYFTHVGGEVKKFSPEKYMSHEKISMLCRASQMGLAAAKLAIADAGLDKGLIENYKAGICIGTTMGSAQTIEAINKKRINNERIETNLAHRLPTHTTSTAIAEEFNINGPAFMFSTACAAGNYAIGYGHDLIKLGRADMIIAGASDTFSRISFSGFNQFGATAPEKCQPFDKNRKGMIVAEGSGVLVLESLESAIKRNASIYAEISGYGLSCDAYHMTVPSVEGIAECIRKTLREAGMATGEIDYISAHGTGTVANDRAECAAIEKIFGARLGQIPVSSIKSMLGHTLGAASALEAIACALAVKNNIIPPTINHETPDPECTIDCVPNKARQREINIALNNSYAFGGNNASLIVKSFQ